MNSKPRHRYVRPACFAILALVVGPLCGATVPITSPLVFQAQAESRVRITGRATLGDWECESKEIIATIEPGPELATLADRVRRGGNIPAFDAKNLRMPHALVTIPVTSLQCNKPGMRDEVLRALRSDEAPLIVFVLTGISDVQIQPRGKSDLGRYRVMARGDLVLGGKLRAIDLAANVVQESASRFRIDAVKELRMSDFDITPPVALFGIIRANDNVTVSFNLTFEIVSFPLPPSALARTR